MCLWVSLNFRRTLLTGRRDDCPDQIPGASTEVGRGSDTLEYQVKESSEIRCTDREVSFTPPVVRLQTLKVPPPLIKLYQRRPVTDG